MNFLTNGKLSAGCNYWASHAGIKMWTNWNEEVVDEDFRQISSLGIKLIRVFPLWSEFQPIDAVYGYLGCIEGYSIDGGDTLLDSFDRGIDERMMKRFEKMLDLAEKHHLRVIPSLLTGWMSGRLFAPPALKDKNLICDPVAIKWEVRFIKEFVSRFKDRDCIAAWCLGNECNCMSDIESSSQAWLWMDTVSDAFRAIDPDRPVISGMHAQFTPGETHWTLQDCGENCDYITTHPYSSPEYSTERDRMNTIKPLLHPASQTIYSSCIGGKPCFIEETGTYGQMYGNEEFNAKYMEGALYTAWSHDCLAYLWWIGYDQGSLTYHPFGYNNRASNYGLFREDRTIKPVGEVIKDFNGFTDKFGTLPGLLTDAVCIVTPGQNTWYAAGAAFILAKQARMDITYAYSKDKLPDAKAYLIPSIHSANAFGAGYIKELMQKVADGAVLYISLGHGFPRNLTDDFGFELVSRKHANGIDEVYVDGSAIKLQASVNYDIKLNSAVSLAKNSQSQDVYLRAPYGKGTVFVLMYPMESYLYGVDGSFASGEYYKIYDELKKYIDSGKAVSCDNRMIGITEHPVSDSERIVVLTNYSDDTVTEVTASNWTISECLRGNAELSGSVAKIGIENCKTVVLKLKK